VKDGRIAQRSTGRRRSSFLTRDAAKDKTKKVIATNRSLVVSLRAGIPTTTKKTARLRLDDDEATCSFPDHRLLHHQISEAATLRF
jgi:hypothetical protein